MNPQLNFNITVEKEKELLKEIRENGLELFYPIGEEGAVADYGAKCNVAYITDSENPIDIMTLTELPPSMRSQFFLENPWVEYSTIYKEDGQGIARIYLEAGILDANQKKRLKDVYGILKKIIKSKHRAGDLQIIMLP